MQPKVRPDERRLGAWRALLAVSTLTHQRLDRELLAERGMPLAWYEVLLRLWDAPGRRLRIQELAGRALLSKSGLSQLVTRMEAAGLVVREECPSDRRGTNAVLTPEGRRAFLRAARVHLRGIQEHFGRHLDDDEAETLRGLLEPLAAARRNDEDKDEDEDEAPPEEPSPGPGLSDS